MKTSETPHKKTDMKRLSIIISSLLLCCLVIYAQDDTDSKGIIFHQNESWERILELARKENKLIFMDCYTTWCSPCKALAKEVFPRSEVGDFFNPRFINVQYDMEKGDGKMLNDKYKQYIIGYPTMLLIDKDGKVLQQMAGYQEPDKLIEGMRRASEGEDLFSLRKRYWAGERDFKLIKNYMAALEGAFLKDTIVAVTTDYFSHNDPRKLDDDDVWSTFGKYVNDINTPVFEHLARNAARYSYKLHRDYYKMSRQLENALKKETRRLTRISFDKDGTPQPLISDSAAQERILFLMSEADLKRINETKAKFTIHNLLLKENLVEAWSGVKWCLRAGFTGFYTSVVNDYIRYMAAKTNDKRMLKDFLQTLEQYERKEKSDSFFTYGIYKTMAELNSRLGNKKLAAEQMKEFERIDKEKTEELEAIFGK